MNWNKFIIIVIAYCFISMCFYHVSFAQEGHLKSDTTDLDIEELKGYAKMMVADLEVIFNMLGSQDTPNKEKDVIIKDSYIKFFRDEKVQIQDDLDENRDMTINKDVQAYLKDIDFFFKDVEFDFEIQNVNHYFNDDNKLFFVVEMNRNLKGITLTNDSINNNQLRYVEINYDIPNNSLKIASIYTSKLNQEEDLRNWWNNLSAEWQDFFGNDILISDSINLNDIELIDDSTLIINGEPVTSFNRSALYRNLKRISNMQEIDLSGNLEITDLSAISKLSELQEVNISDTRVTDIIPLRNLTKLEVLVCSKCLIDDISPLKYATNLKELYFNHTPLSKISVLENFPKLVKLDISGTKVNDLSPVASLDSLVDLRIGNTLVSDLSPLQNLNKLEILNCSNTNITDLSPLSETHHLTLLFCNNTGVGSLEPLQGLKKIQKIYCDNTNISLDEANIFMADHPGSLVIYATDELARWWENLSDGWRSVFASYVPFDNKITKEQLHEIAKLTKIDINNNKSINTLKPLSKLTHLRFLDAEGTNINALSPLAFLIDLKHLNCSHTGVVSLSPLSNLRSLEVLNCENTGVSSLDPILDLPNLKMVYVDATEASMGKSKQSLYRFIDKHPDCLVIYRTGDLKIWWDNLSHDWRAIFRKFVHVDSQPTKEQLHKIVSLKKLDLSDNPVPDIEPLNKLRRLEELNIAGTVTKDLHPIRKNTRLIHLNCSRNPVQNLEPLKNMNRLKYINCENTQIESLEPLAYCQNIEVLKCSGTKINKLKGLEYLYRLKKLDCSNTDVRKLKRLDELKYLQQLKCFNTRISEKRVEKFKKSHPECEVIYY
jgi:Leucine-rich repeat (LRR) protein